MKEKMIGLWRPNLAAYLLNDVVCFDCEKTIPAGNKAYRLVRFQEQELVTEGYLCEFCWRALEPRMKGYTYTPIEKPKEAKPPETPAPGTV